MESDELSEPPTAGHREVASDEQTGLGHAQEAVEGALVALHDVLTASGIHQPEASSEAEYLAWTVVGVRFALPIRHVREVLPTLPLVTSFLDAADWLLGIFLYDNEVIGLADAGVFFGSSEAQSARRAEVDRALRSVGAIARARLQVVIVAVGPVTLGLLVDDVHGVLHTLPQPSRVVSTWGLGTDVVGADGQLFEVLNASAFVAAMTGDPEQGGGNDGL